MNTQTANKQLYNGVDENRCFDEMISDLHWECRPTFKVTSPSCSLKDDFPHALIVYHTSYASTSHKEPPKHHLLSSSLYINAFLITQTNKILSSVLSCLNYVFHHYIPSTLRFTFLKLHSPHLGYKPFC